MSTDQVCADPDSASAVLAGLRAEQSVIDRADVAKLRLAVRWASMHSADSLVGPVSAWSEGLVRIGGEGCPEVTEFCIPELAAALEVSHDSAAAFLGDAVELAYRLPRTYARVLAGQLRVWKARRIAQSSVSLPMPGAAFVDRHLAGVGSWIGWAALDRLIEEARVRFDPEAAEARRLEAAESRYFEISTDRVDHTGVVAVSGTLDYVDALDLQTAVTAGTAQLQAAGCTESEDVRRSLAVGELARREATLDFETGQPTNAQRRRQIVLHVHLADPSVARVEGLGPAGGCLSVAQVTQWCQRPESDVTIRPVIDLNAHDSVTAYEIPDRMREHVVLRDKTCVFPQCHRGARRSDLDHIVAWDPGGGGKTSTANLAALCRRHHRLKTHGGWRYERTAPGVYRWTSPHAQVIDSRQP